MPSPQLLAASNCIVHGAACQWYVALQSKRFGYQTFEQSKPDTEAGNPGLTEYLKLGRAIGESPKEIEKNLRARGVPVSWDNTAEDYMQK